MTKIEIFHDGPIVKRSDAKVNGDKLYFTGKPCKRGHVAQRYIGSSNCVECYKTKEHKVKQLKYAAEYWSKPENKLRAKVNREALVSDNEWQCRRKSYLLEYNSRQDVKKRKAQWQSEKYKCEDYKAMIAKRQRDRNATPRGKTETFIRNSLRRCLSNSGTSVMNYTASDLKHHITNMLHSGMSWENYGDWHIDHIIPVSWFIKAGVNDPNVINKLSNLRPLWAKDNLSKGGV